MQNYAASRSVIDAKDSFLGFPSGEAVTAVTDEVSRKKRQIFCIFQCTLRRKDLIRLCGGTFSIGEGREDSFRLSQ